ncbi:unnamed protein product [Owenia fusiformis]|uniref:Uncharacterized protein n=1 Tax=Owenia fusiformis TaxID=6347 RepID=A0A8S4PYF0_OWEFU|nr:unnamed protein product [Owenia fusiformis]
MKVFVVVLAVCLLLVCVHAQRERKKNKDGREGGKRGDRRPGKVKKPRPGTGTPCPDANNAAYEIEWKGRKACCKDGIWKWPTGGPVLVEQPNGQDKAEPVAKRCRGSGIFTVTGPNKCDCVRSDICPEEGDLRYENWCCVDNVWKYPNGNGETYFSRYIQDDAKEIELRCKGGRRFQIMGPRDCGCLPYTSPRQGPNVEQAGLSVPDEVISLGRCKKSGDFILINRNYNGDNGVTTTDRNIPAMCTPSQSGRPTWNVLCWPDMEDHQFAQAVCEGLRGCKQGGSATQRDCKNVKVVPIAEFHTKDRVDQRVRLKFTCSGPASSVENCQPELTAGCNKKMFRIEGCYPPEKQ